MGGYYGLGQGGPWWNPAYWTKKTYLIIAGGAVVILAIVIPVSVVVTKNNAYPDYTALSYSLSETYSTDSFFDNFDYYTGYDPSNGFVHYVPKTEAESLNLTTTTSSAAFIKVDTSVGPSSSPDASTGRFSVRLSSKNQYDSGLFIFDVKHTPYGCATWPALWLSDTNNWPEHGEIDIMEAVNQATSGNQVTLHTSGGCTMKSVKRKMEGTSIQADCHNTTNDNAGCGVEGDTDTYGSTYNSDGGGTVAVEWRTAGIRVWQFANDSVPSDITDGSPDPSTWGTALADFPDTKCDISSHFKNASIIANIDLCGDYAGNLYPTSGCPLNCVGSHTCIGGTSPTNCTDYVANHPTAFANAYWEFGSFKVYTAS